MSESRYLSLTSIFVGYAAVLLAVVALTLSMTKPWSNDTFLFFFYENGVVESLSCLFYLVTCILVWRARNVSASVRVALILLLLILAVRELDFHNRFTAVSLLRTDFFFTSEQPMEQRLFFGAIMGGIGLYSAVALWGCICPFLRALWRRDSAAVMTATGFLFLPLARSLDGHAKDWKPILEFDKLDESIWGPLTTIEETLELLAPISFVLAILFLTRRINSVRSIGRPVIR